MLEELGEASPKDFTTCSGRARLALTFGRYRHGEGLIGLTTHTEQSEAASPIPQRTLPQQIRFQTEAEADIWGAQ